jgi:hypothetical protein
MRYIKQFILLSVIISVFACQELIDLDLTQSAPKVVIEGQITDQSGPHKIKVSRTTNYYDTAGIPPVSDAVVQLLDDSENLIEQFNYYPEDSSFRSSENWAGEVGQTYILSVEADGDIYQAKGKILENATLDSLYFLSSETLEALGQNVLGDDGYYLFANGVIRGDGIQYYRLQVKVNDTLKNTRGDIANSVLSSELFGREFVGLPIPGTFQASDTIDLSLASLSEDTYRYYIEFINLLFNDGGVFSPPPVNPTTNIVNITTPNKFALGFVQFSSVLNEQVIIPEEEE